MRVLRHVLLGAVGMLLIAGVMRCQAEALPWCRMVALDVQVLPGADADGWTHTLAVEFRNRGRSGCRLPHPNVELLPGPADLNFGPLSAAERAVEYDEVELGPTDAAHMLLAWSSAPTPLKGLALASCRQFDSLTVSLDSQDKPLKIPHLWMRECGSVYVSRYRVGSYAGEGPIASEWLSRLKLRTSDFAPALPLPTIETAAISLRALFDVEFVSGFFELYLDAPDLAVPGCPFKVLSRRDPDGETTVELGHCASSSSTNTQALAGKEVRLDVRGAGLMPQNPGRAEYEVLSEVLESSKRVLARAQSVEISIRDMKAPMVPVIDSTVPGCRAAQLRVMRPPALLGQHWTEPKQHAPKNQEWHDAEIVEVTNMSAETCQLGGVPKLHFKEPPELAAPGVSLVPNICANCATPLFKPRPSRWIDLKPNDSAHFFVARTILDKDYWFLCTLAGGFDLILPGDEERISMPFDAAICGQMRVSAWRAGKYDGDPLNVRFEQEEQGSTPKLAKPLPADCAKADFTNTGRPVMFAARNGVAMGISVARDTLARGERVPLHVWIDNQKDQPAQFFSCDMFWGWGVEVWDTYGHRLLNNTEIAEREARESGKVLHQVRACTANISFSVAPHTCENPSLAAHELKYDLTPGQYVITEAPPKATSAGDSSTGEKPKTPPAAGEGLIISIIEP